MILYFSRVSGIDLFMCQDRENLHSFVYSLYPSSKIRDFLFCVDGDKIEMISRKAPVNNSNLDIKTCEIYTESLDNRRCRFLSTFSPQYRDKYNIRRCITKPDEIRDNVFEQFNKMGCECESIFIKGRYVRNKITKKDGNVIHFKSITCDGVVKVSSSELVFMNGLGKEKAYGFGMVYLWPLN